MSLKQRQKHERRRADALSPIERPHSADAMAGRMATALQLHQKGDVAAAEDIYHDVLRLHPRHAEALHYLGMAYYQRRRLAEAADLMERSIEAAEPLGGRAFFHSNYGLVLHDQGRLDAAVAAYRQALELRPDYPEALSNLGNTLQAQGKFDEALELYRRAIGLQPAYVQAYCNAGAVLKKQERLTEAEQAYRTVLRLNPCNADAHYNLANTLYAQDRLDEAVEHFRRALAEKPNYPQAHLNWGNVLIDQGRGEAAIAQYKQALERDPACPNADDVLDPAADISLQTGHAPKEETVATHMNLAMAHLVSGNFAEGLSHYEWRHHSAEATRSRAHPQPMWRGGPIEGKTILLHWEQGLGDTLHLLRYAPMVRARGARVVLEVQPCLARLAAAMAPDFTVVREGQPLPPFDLHCPLMSLPFAFDTRLQTVPADVPYLRVPKEEMSHAAATLPWPTGSLKVGLVWAGSPKHLKDKHRSLKLSQLEPVLALLEVRFFSLQVGAGVDQLADFTAVDDLAPDPANMADTAAKIAHLDLVIAADTAIAHLAGALGKPVWVLLPFAPDWRWLRDREDSPWYPTMRLFRQTTMFGWIPVVERVAEALRAEARLAKADRLS